MHRLIFALLIVLIFTPFIHADDPTRTPAGYLEIPYYLHQLQETELESKRMEYNKIIHEAVVNADLSDKKVVKKMEPIIQKIQIVMDSGFDRPYLEGESMWLQSAVDYYEREKYRQLISIPQSDWSDVQSKSTNGLRLSIFPEKILLLNNEKTQVIAESSNIHEAIISPNGNKVAFFRRTDENSNAEIWVIDIKSRKRKKVASISSCSTILFSLDGRTIFLQEKPQLPNDESSIFRVSTSGGGFKIIGKAQSLETIVDKGKKKGSLIVFKITKHHMGITQQSCPYAWDPSGAEIGRLRDIPCR